MKRESKRVGFAIATIATFSFLVACSALLKKKDAGDEDPDLSALLDAQTTQVTGTGAKNETAILRYANETQLGGLPAILGKETIARNFPGNGPIVATLPKGTIVAKVAQYFSTGVLIMFADPIGDGSQLLGWVPVTSFDVAAPPPTKTIVVPKLDAGPPKPQDAGGGTTPTTQDAGGKPTADAGNNSDLPADPDPKKLAILPTNGKCPSTRVLSESMCRLKCTSDATCPRNSKCVSKPGGKVCSSG
jgi:hypothetical protein